VDTQAKRRNALDGELSMARPRGKHGAEFRRAAVRLPHEPGHTVGDVAASADEFRVIAEFVQALRGH